MDKPEQNDSRKAKKASMRKFGITGKQYRRALRWSKREAKKAFC